VQGKNCLQ